MHTCSICPSPAATDSDLCPACYKRRVIVPMGVIGAMVQPRPDSTLARTRPPRTAEELAELSRAWEETYGTGRE